MRQKPIRLFSRAAIVLLMMMLTATTAWAETENLGGYEFTIETDAEGQYYKVDCTAALNALAAYVNAGNSAEGKRFVQTDPITLTSDWTPIGTNAAPFKGNYDGGGNTISGLRVSTTGQYAGLFGYIKGGQYDGPVNTQVAEVHNVVLENPSITITPGSATNANAGAVVGYAGDNARIYDCTVIGGTVTYSNVSSPCSSNNNFYAGGIVGYYDASNIYRLSGNKVSATTVSGGNICGGIAGYLSKNNAIYGNVADATVSATKTYFSTGQSTEDYRQGAIAGYVASKNSQSPSLNYYHTTAGLTAYGKTVGHPFVTVADGNDAARIYTVTLPDGLSLTGDASYTIGTARYYIAGATASLTVDDANKAITTFTATGAASSEVAADKKSATVTLGSSDVTVSTTLMDLTGTVNGVTWSMSDSDSNGTYDRLTLSGSGTLSTSPWATDFAASITRVDISSADIAISGNPFSTLADGVDIVAPTPAYAVSYASAAFAGKLRVALGNQLFTATNEGDTPAYAITDDIDLQHLAAAINNGSEGIANSKIFRQTGNITFSNINFVPIGFDPTKCFSGTYDGGGYTISNLHVNFINSIVNNVMTYGLFGYVRNGLVENVRLVSPSVNVSDANSAYCYGALIGCADGTNGASTTIRNCVVISPEINASGMTQGAIIGAQDGCELENLYFYGGNCNNAIGGKYSGTGAVRAYKVTLGSGVSIQTEMADDLGFSYDGDGTPENYWRQGAELTLGNTLGEVPEYYALIYTATAGTINGSTLTVGSDDATVSAAIRSDGQSHSISYVDEKGENATHDAIALDGTETTLSAGWYFVGKDINYTDKITLTGDVNIILADGKTMSVAPTTADYGIDGSSDGSLTIYGQSAQSGALTATNDIGIYTDGTVTINGGTVIANGTDPVGIRSIDGITINRGTVTTTGIMADGDVTINGGKVTATEDPGISSNSGNITLGWTNTSDFIKASSYCLGDGKSVNIASGKAFADEDGNIYTGTLSSDEKSKLAGKTLTPACIITLPEGLTATGVIEQNGTTAYAKAGDAITLAVASGYLLNGDITYTPDGGSATATTEDNGSYSFTMPAGNVTVNANIIKIISYIDADGKLQTISNYKKFPAEYNSGWDYWELTTTTLNAGEWYVVDTNINLGGIDDVLNVNGNGAANIILCDGKRLDYVTYDGNIHGSLNIYGQSKGTGVFEYINRGSSFGKNSLIDGNLTIYGGSVTIEGSHGEENLYVCQCAIDGNVTIYRGSLYAKGGDNTSYSGQDAIHGNVYFHGGSLTAIGGSKGGNDDCYDGWGIYGKVSLDWSSASDRFKANRYGDAMTIAEGKAFADEDGNIYTGTLNYAQANALAEKTLKPALLLADDADNSTQITALNGLTTAAILQDRTLYKDGDWNTLVLPFDVTSAQMAETTHPLYGATIMELDIDGTYEGGKQTGLDGTTLYLYFKNATAIEAGKPYIVRWGTPENPAGGTIENPAFTGVTIDKTNRYVTFNGGWFEGTYSPKRWTEENQSILFLGDANTLYYPEAGASLGACRAYFELDPNAHVREFNINFDEHNETTGILSTTDCTDYTDKADATWYTINGVKLDKEPTKPGLYIYKGKKVKR